MININKFSLMKAPSFFKGGLVEDLKNDERTAITSPLHDDVAHL